MLPGFTRLIRPLALMTLIKNLGCHRPGASGVKCGPHGGKNSKMKSVDRFLVEPQNQGRARTSWEPSHKW
jgi:hypothetical protein